MSKQTTQVVARDDGHEWSVRDAKTHRKVAVCVGAKAQEQADLIARAVNSHDDLLEACELANRLIDNLLKTRAIREDEPGFDWNLLNAAMTELPDAIVRARGE